MPTFKENGGRDASVITFYLVHAYWDMVFPLDNAFAHLITRVGEDTGGDRVVQGFKDANPFAKYCLRRGLKVPTWSSSDSDSIENQYLNIFMNKDIVRTLREKNWL
jgi:hypothetical protein